MEELLQQLSSPEGIQKALEQLKAQGKDPKQVENFIKEVDLKERTLRQTQVGQIQKNKTVGEGNKRKTVEAVRIPINFQKKIVNTGVTFEVGEPVTLVAKSTVQGKEPQISELIKKLWKTNRVDSKIQQLIRLKKAQTQSALQFYITDIKEGSMIQKLLASLKITSQKKEIKVSVLDNKKGSMYPYFDAFGDMKAFVWSFITKDAGGKEFNNEWIYDEKNVYKISDTSGSMVLDSTEPHGFTKIPIVYVSQEHPEWFDVQEMIDRIEVSLSKLGASNDYSGHPMLKIFGEVENAPDKDEDGKAWVIPMSIDDEGNVIKGDVDFLTNSNAPDSTKLELEKLEEYIEMVSQTPNVSLSKLKGIGDISAKAIRLLFIDAMMKAKLNEGDNRTAIERMINVMISGITNTTNTSLSGEAKDLYFEIQFNSILPDDLKEASDVMAVLVEKGLIAKKTAIEYLGMTEDVEGEMQMINTDKEPVTPEPQNQE